MFKQDISKQPASFVVYLLLLIVLGAQTMIVELSIPRLIAPVFGNTLFSWTAIIAVVLTALAVGYEFGGRLAQRGALQRNILLLSFASALWVIAISVWGERVVAAFSGLGMLFGPLVTCGILAAIPAGLAAGVVPLAVQLSTQGAGKASGSCFSWSTAGSIVGVLITGYVLLPSMGIEGALLTGAALTLVSISLLNMVYSGAGLLIIASSLAIDDQRDPLLLVDKSNGYHRIRVFEQQNKNRRLFLDSTLEGAVAPGSLVPPLDYQKQIKQIVTALTVDRILFIGGGSFSMPKYVKFLLPNARVESIEIDKDVIAVAESHLELSQQILIHNGDGRRVLTHIDGGYDVIVNDAFRGQRKIPFHLTTHEFNQVVTGKLSNPGVYLINVLGSREDSRLARAIIATLRQSFDYIYTINQWLLATNSPMELGEPVPKVAGTRILTDDSAPIEYLIMRDLVGTKSSSLR